MNTLESALQLAKMGFHVFPLQADGKTPVMPGAYRTVATRDPKLIKLNWIDPATEIIMGYNVGISTDLFGDDQALVVIDIDMDKEKGVNGLEQLKILKSEGRNFPSTFTVQSPRGGFHLYYKSNKAITQGAGVFGKGIDVRSGGGLVVGIGSENANGRYKQLGAPKDIAQCPQWIINKQGVVGRTEEKDSKRREGIQEADVRRIREYIRVAAPEASYGNITDISYRVACAIKDLGASQADCEAYLFEWSELKCGAPGMEAQDIEKQVNDAYNYGKRPIGADSPVHDFDVVKEEEESNDNPILKYNSEYAFTIEGGSSVILWETVDFKEDFFLDRIKLESFYQKFAADTAIVNEKPQNLAKLWMKHPKRRTYERVVFAPGTGLPENMYNLWNGFSVNALGTEEKPTQQMVDGIEAFKEHIYENVCGETEFEYKWLMSFFAHLIQKPGEKPLVAPVLRGKKGVGKDTPVNIVGKLIERYYYMASDSRSILGNFNAHLEHCLLLALNEAFWSGDKRAEGSLKHLITGDKHIIERKGKEITVAKNYTRVVIIGNEAWLVPATVDERRFAVFDIGEKRIQDVKFFKNMKENMEAGGYRLLLRYLLDYKRIDINTAPNNEALTKQKIKSMGPFQLWWRQCVLDGGIQGSLADAEWPKEIQCSEVRDAFYQSCQARGVRYHLPDASTFGMALRDICGAIRKRKRIGGNSFWFYKMPSLTECRAAWEKNTKLNEEWEVDPLDELGV